MSSAKNKNYRFSYKIEPFSRHKYFISRTVNATGQTEIADLEFLSQTTPQDTELKGYTRDFLNRLKRYDFYFGEIAKLVSYAWTPLMLQKAFKIKTSLPHLVIPFLLNGFLGFFIEAYDEFSLFSPTSCDAYAINCSGRYLRNTFIELYTDNEYSIERCITKMIEQNPETTAKILFDALKMGGV